MNEVNLFKESFYLGRMIWVKGPPGSRKVRATYDLLKSCGVLDAQVSQIDAVQLVNIFTGGIPRTLLSRYRVLIVRNFDRLSDENWSRFLEVLSQYRFLQFDLGVRMILVSSEGAHSFEETRLEDLKQFSLVEVSVSRFESINEDHDTRVHGLIEQASKVAGKKIYRISEEVATFLEILPFQGHDDALVELLVRAVRDSSKGTLELENFPADNCVELQ